MSKSNLKESKQGQSASDLIISVEKMQDSFYNDQTMKEKDIRHGAKIR